MKSEEVYALERRGFWDGVDFHLDAIEQTNARKKERDKQKSTKQINIKEYKELKVCMHVNA